MERKLNKNINNDKCVRISNTIKCSNNVDDNNLTPNEEKLVIGLYSAMKNAERKKCPGCGQHINPESFAKELVQSITKYNTQSTFLAVTDMAQLLHEIKSLNLYSIFTEAKELKDSIRKIGKSFGCDNMEKYNGLTTLESYFIDNSGRKIWHQDCHPYEPHKGYSESCDHEEHMSDSKSDF